MNARLSCPRRAIEVTLAHLRAGGERRCETVVLWLGAERDGRPEVQEVYRPEQIVDIDFFRIPPESMRALMARLRETRWHILAQVHSHPALAFHSEADDRWAIIRREGALSLVLPYFASRTTADTFADHAATYRLNQVDQWIGTAFASHIEIV